MKHLTPPNERHVRSHDGLLGVKSFHSARKQTVPARGQLTWFRMLTSRGKLAMNTTASAAYLTSKDDSVRIDPSGWRYPTLCLSALILVSALPHGQPSTSVGIIPMSSWEQAMLNGRPSTASVLVRPRIACLDMVYGAA